MYQLSWQSFAIQLPDGDLINLAIHESAVPTDVVEFVLESLVSGWKAIRIPSGLGHDWEIWTEGNARIDRVRLPVDFLGNGQKLELKKAKFLGVHTGMYELGALGQLKPGSQVFFQWVQDAHIRNDAGLVGSVIDLPSRPEGDALTAWPGQKFDFSLRFYNRTDGPQWTNEGRYCLAPAPPYRPNDPSKPNWMQREISLPRPVSIFESCEFAFRPAAPQERGRYSFHWRMLQRGVGFFGPWGGRTIDVIGDPPPPPAPSEGNLTIDLIQDSRPQPTYNATTPDPSISSAYPAPRRARIRNLTNLSRYTLLLSHIDRVRSISGPIEIAPGATLTSPFEGFEIEGRWQANLDVQPARPPISVAVSVSWRV